MTLFGGLVTLPISLPILEVMIVSFFVGILGGMMGLVLGSFRLAMLVSLIQDPFRLASTNIIINTFVGAVSAFEYWRLKRVRYREFFLIGAFTWVGAIAGSLTSRFLSQNLLFFLLGGLLCLSGGMMILGLFSKKKKLSNEAEDEMAATNSSEETRNMGSQLGNTEGLEQTSWTRWGKYLVTGIYCLVTTFLASTVGLILSEIRLPVMMNWLGMPPLYAAGTNMAISIIAGILATLGYIFVGNYDLVLIASVGSVSVIGAFIGAHVSANVPEFWLKALIAVTVVTVGVTLLMKSR